MGGRWGPDGPPPEAYSRVTNPERFAPVVDAADAMVDELVRVYDVESTAVEVDGAVRAVRLTPSRGAPLVIAVTSFPGVRVLMGMWTSTPVPICGCDACDEDADSAIELLKETVGDVVAGRFGERLTRHPRRLWSRRGNGRGWTTIDRDTFERLAAAAPPGEREWPPWPERPRRLPV
jgi:hypothetical protein